MASLRFANAEVVRCMEHALAAPSHSKTWGETRASAALHLVKDDGIYVMSNGTPRDIVDEEKGSSFVAYAKGYDPRTGDVWEKCRAAVGGDDFAESITLTPQIVQDVREGADLIVKMTATQFSVITALKKEIKRESVEALLAEYKAKGKLLVYRSNRETRLRIFDLRKGDTPQSLAFAIRRKYPKAVILSEMPTSQAVDEYIRRASK